MLQCTLLERKPCFWTADIICSSFIYKKYIWTERDRYCYKHKKRSVTVHTKLLTGLWLVRVMHRVVCI